MSTKDRRETGLIIGNRRRRHQLSRTQLAERLGCSTSHVRNLENGWRPVTPALATRLNAVLGLALPTDGETS